MTFPELVAAELERARAEHEAHPTLEHSYTVLMLELEEVKAEIRNRHRCRARIRAELVQVACVAQRMCEDNGLI
jgi:hypothetical protein